MSAVLNNVDDRAPLAPLPDQALLQRARDVQPRIAALAAQYDASGEPPAQQIQDLFDADLLRLTIAKRDGGHGAGIPLASEIVRIIAQADPSVALILAMQYSQHAVIARSQRQPDADKRTWHEALVRQLTQDALARPALINAIQAEAEWGSPSHGSLPAAIARRDGDTWRISGRKIYATGSHLLEWFNVLAVTDEPVPRVGFFLVPGKAQGVSIIETWKPLGMRATASHDVVLEDVRIPLSQTADLYPAANGLRRNEDSAAWFMNLIASVYTGVAIAARDWVVKFLQARKPTQLGGASLATLPGVQESVGRIQILIDTSVSLLRSHAEAHAQGKPFADLGNTARYVAVENAIRASAFAVELAGNHGISANNELERHFRNARCAQIHAPTAALLRGNVGRAVFARSTESVVA